GFPFGAGGERPVTRNHSIRLLAQAADSIKATIVGEDETEENEKTSVHFHQPLLLTAAVTSVRFRQHVAAIEILSVPFEPVRLSNDLVRYSELHVAPRAGWPDGPFKRDDDDLFQIVAPNLRATSGAMRVGYANL